MSKRNSIVILILLVLGASAGTAAFLYRALTTVAPSGTALMPELSVTPPAPSPSGQKPAPSPSEEGGASRSPAEQEHLRKKAMAIINRPARITTSLSPETESLVRLKIGAMADLIRGNFDYVNPWLDLGAYLRIAGDYEGTVQAWKFATEIRPTNSIAFQNLGDLYAFTLKNYAEGEQYFLKSISVNPKNTQNYFALAMLYENPMLGKQSEIAGILLRGIAANPEDVTLKTRLAEYYRDNGNSEAALRYFEEALRLSPAKQVIQHEIDELKKGV